MADADEAKKPDHKTDIMGWLMSHFPLSQGKGKKAQPTGKDPMNMNERQAMKDIGVYDEDK